MSEQKIPGVVDAKLPPISEKTYATLLAIMLSTSTVVLLMVASLLS